MANGTLGSLTIDVMANIANLVSDLGKAHSESAKHAKEMAKEWQESVDSIKEGFKTIGEIAGIAVSIDWLKDIAKEAYEGAEKLDLLSQSLGLSVTNLQAMSFVAGATGANLETVTTSFVRLERAGQQALAGNQQMLNDFNELGISSSELAELLKNPDKMIEEVTQKLSGFRDGTAKTTLTLELMGRGAAEAIPFINEFGGNIEEAKDKAREFGILLSDTDQHSLKQTQEDLNLAGQAAKGMGNEFALGLAPAVRMVAEEFTKLATSESVKEFFKDLGQDINQVIVIGGQIGSMLADMVSRFNSAIPQIGTGLRKLFSGMGGDIVSFIQEAQDAFSRLGAGIKQMWLEVEVAAKVIWTEIGNAFKAVIAGVLQSLASVADWESGLYAKLHLSSLSNTMDGVSASLKSMAAGFKQTEPDIQGLSDKIDQNREDLRAAIADHAAWADGVRKSAAAMSDSSKAVEDNDKKLLNHDANIKEQTANQNKLNAELVKWQEMMEQLTVKAAGPYDAALKQFTATMNKADAEIIAMMGHGLTLAQAMELDAKATDLATEAMWKQIAADVEKNDKADDYLQKLKDELSLLGNLTESQKAAAEFDKIAAQNMLTLHDAFGQAYETEQEVIDANRGLRQGFIDNATAIQTHIDAVKRDQEELKQWQSIATNAFDQAFSAINKDILEGGSVMKDLVNVAKQVVQAILLEFEKLAIINPILNQVFGLNGTSGQLPTSSFGSIFNNIGNLFGGGSGGGGGLFGGGGIFGGGGGTTGGDPDFMPGGALFGQSAGNSFVGTVAPYLLLAGSAYAGINEFNAAGGGVNGAIGAATYAAGTYFAGAALATAGAIPVIGWVAIAAMLVDKFTGGNLFGTKFKPTGVTGANVDVNGSGVSITDWYQEHKHGALFSGGTYKNVDVAATKEQQDAYNQAFEAEQKSIQTAATALGVTVGDEISGAWAETTDKTGKVVSQTTTIMGQKFQEDAQHFFERLTADNELQLLGSEAQTVAQQWQSSADTLMDGTAMLLAAQVDMNHGIGLLGSSDTSLADVAKVVEDLQQGSETLVQTYARLQAETQSFKSEMDMIGLHINATGADFVKFADAAAQAAGGIDKLNSELTQLYQMYTPVSTQVQNSLDNAKKASQTSLTAIGEDPNETMAQFWQDFQNAMPNLTPDELQQWITAGLNLGAYTNAVTNSANAMQQLADFQVQLYGDQFVSAMAGAVEWEKKQIDTANQLARAAGEAGASQQTLAQIMTAGTVMMGKAVADLTTGIYSDIGTLYTALAPASSGNAYTDFGLNIGRVNPITGPDPAAQKQAQQQSAAYDLIAKLGDLEYITGKSVDDVLKQFNLTPEEIAKILGISPDQVKQDIDSQSKNDASMLKLVAQGDEQTGLLQDLVEIAQGKSPTYDWTGLGAPDTTSLSGGPNKVGNPRLVVGPSASQAKSESANASQPIVDATTNGSDNVVSAINRQSNLLQELLNKIPVVLQSAPPRNEPARAYARP